MKATSNHKSHLQMIILNRKSQDLLPIIVSKLTNIVRLQAKVYMNHHENNQGKIENVNVKKKN